MVSLEDVTVSHVLFSAAALLLLRTYGSRRLAFELIEWSLWVLISLIASSLQWLLVWYNSFRILINLVLFASLRMISSFFRSIRAMFSWSKRRDVETARKLTLQLQTAQTFSEWQEIARKLDVLDGASKWRTELTDDPPLFDHELLASHLKQLRKARNENDVHDMMICLRAVFNRKFCGLDNPALFNQSRTGTKLVIEEYVKEVTATLQHVCNADYEDCSLDQKLEFFANARLSMGRTALCLSGGGSLSMYHMGVVKSLLEHQLLPRVISGTSGGSIVAALLACKTDHELLDDVIKPDISNKYGKRWFQPISSQILHFFGKGVLMDSEFFSQTCRAYYENITFEEAYKRTGRIVNITISAAHRGGGSRGHPLLLNYFTAPEVLLWSAVTASCALPGLMSPVQLMARDRNGNEVPFYPSGMQWIDGSIQSDCPTAELSMMFNCNQFIVSQVNPHVVPFLANYKSKRLFDRFEYFLSIDIRQRCQKLAKLRLIPRLYGQDFSGVFMQSYKGHVTITPTMSLTDQLKAISHPDEDDMKRYIREGQISAWPFLGQIKHMCAIESTLRLCYNKIKRRLEPSALKVPRSVSPVHDGPYRRFSGVEDDDVELEAAALEPSSPMADDLLRSFASKSGQVRVSLYASGRNSTPKLLLPAKSRASPGPRRQQHSADDMNVPNHS
eukprot:GILJ01008696.1.p1 GENE.GILJ01008696.1~~GILJ01008696.1.p1  ORF type:complete len:688 (+),score=66.97 GILJ01008696.1:43-2064(+)